MRFLLTVCLIVTLFSTNSSCTKTEEKIIKDTVFVPKTDTLLVAAKDTTFKMDASAWNGFAYDGNTSIIASGPTTFFNTSEGIKILAQSPRYGLRIQTKSELAFQGKTLYYKWKLNGAGQFASAVIQVKYDPLTTDFGEIQGKDIAIFTVLNSVTNGTQVQNDAWYYTRIFPSGTDQYTVVTATSNYDNKGGVVIATTNKLIYTKHGYPAIRLGDPFSSSAFLILGECKIASN
jgi:hypothetical protein